MLNPVATFRAALSVRDVRLLLSGLAASQAGDWLYNLALLALVYGRTHSSVWVGLTTAARIIPEVALGPLGGILADRIDRGRLMIGSDVVRAGIMAALALVMLLGSPAVAFTINGATFLAGALAVAALASSDLRAPAAVSERHPGLRQELKAGWTALRGYDDAIAIVGANVISSAVYGALTVVLVILGHRLGLGPAGYGYLLAAMGVGGVLAAGISNKAASSEDRRRALIASMLAVGAPLPLLAVAGWVPVALILAVVIGAGSVTAEVVGDTCLQRSLDPEVFARAYGLALPAFLGGIAAGALIAPLAIALLGLTGTLIMIGASVIAYAMFVLSQSGRAGRAPVLAATD